MRLVLFSVLGLLVVALAYDFLVARPGQAGAAEKVRALMTDAGGAGMISNAEPVNHEQVREALGCEPTSTEERETCYIERFSWRSGLPWRSHDLYVIFTKTKERYLHDISVGQPPEAGQLPPPGTVHSDSPNQGATATPGAATPTRDAALPPARDNGDERSPAAPEPGGTPREEGANPGDASGGGATVTPASGSESSG
jgi:hypothetical protein